MKYAENAKHNKARKFWKIIFMPSEARLEFFGKKINRNK